MILAQRSSVCVCIIFILARYVAVLFTYFSLVSLFAAARFQLDCSTNAWNKATRLDAKPERLPQTLTMRKRTKCGTQRTRIAWCVLCTIWLGLWALSCLVFGIAATIRYQYEYTELCNYERFNSLGTNGTTFLSAFNGEPIIISAQWILHSWFQSPNDVQSRCDRQM